jgi:fatty-acid desaturase
MYSSTITEYENNEGRKSADPGAEKDQHSFLHEPPIDDTPAEQPLIWRNIIGLFVLHVTVPYLFIKYVRDATLWTWVFYVIHGHLSGAAITAGAHRLWSHRSYKAKLPLRIFFMFFFCSAGQVR